MGDGGVKAELKIRVRVKGFQSASHRDTDDKDVIPGPRKRKVVEAEGSQGTTGISPAEWPLSCLLVKVEVLWLGSADMPPSSPALELPISPWSTTTPRS